MKVQLISAIVVIIAATMCGYAMAAATQRRVRILDDLLHAVRTLQIQVVNVLAPLESALMQSGSTLFKSVAEQLGPGIDVSAAWAKTAAVEQRRGGYLDCLGNQELQPLNQMFALLGSSGRTSQDEALRTCINALEKASQQAQARTEKVAKLYTSLGFLAGLAIVILML